MSQNPFVYKLNYLIFARAWPSIQLICMQDTFARATHSMQPLGQARATIGYLVYNQLMAATRVCIHDSSIYMRASYEELGKSWKKWEQLGKIGNLSS